jgi:magnesium transporter
MMTKSQGDKMLSAMRPDIVSKIRGIMNYPPESAGAIMGTSFIAVPGDFTAQQTIDHLRKIAPSSETLYHIYVVDSENHLLGVLSIRGLITSPPESRVFDLMKKEVIYVKLSTPKEDIAKAIAKYDIFVLPVVSDDNILRGIVTADDVLTEIMPKAWRRHKYKPQRIKRKKKNGSQQPKQRPPEQEAQRRLESNHRDEPAENPNV